MACLMEAADTLSDQPEPARTVVEAAYGSCGKYEVGFGKASVGAINDAGIQEIKAQAITPKVLARVMAIRAAKERIKNEKSAPSPAIDYNRM